MQDGLGFMDILDSLTTYTLAFFVLAFTVVVDHASGIMTVGGILLLGLRLYGDGVKARQVYRESKEWKNDR